MVSDVAIRAKYLILRRLIDISFSRLPVLLAIKYIALKLFSRALLKYSNEHYAAYAEDVIIRSYFIGKENGVYVDVGCNHPIRSSNTFGLYMSGWTGLCIDANGSLIRLHESIRLKDMQLNVAITDNPGKIDYFEAADDSLSTISEDFMNSNKDRYTYKEKKTIDGITLSDAIIRKLGLGIKIDLLDVDVEGHDLEVLRSLDFEKIRPELISVETLDRTSVSHKNEIDRFLLEKNYILLYATNTNSFYRDAKQ